MLFLPIIWLFTAIAIYIAALRNGMAAMRWALAALCLGPLLLPLFNCQKRLALLRDRDVRNDQGVHNKPLGRYLA